MNMSAPARWFRNPESVVIKACSGASITEDVMLHAISIHS